MATRVDFLHYFEQDISQISKPENFTFPFCYDPHILSKIAVQQIQNYLITQEDFEHNFGLSPLQSGLVIGKMFGVLVVEDSEGNLGFLAAVSGKLGNSNQHRYFVPPIYDMLDKNGFFIQEENMINRINTEISNIESGDELAEANLTLNNIKEETQKILKNARDLHKKNKSERKLKRETEKNILSIQSYEGLLQDLIKQSYRDQHEYDVLKQSCKEQVAKAEYDQQVVFQRLTDLKEERKKRSAALQQRLFDQYTFLNALGHQKNVLSIFKEATGILPPAGAGECAAPKLLQFAYSNNLTPLCMAEFWWGASPVSEVRKHKQYYPSCRGKCEPILNHMLGGLKTDPNPMHINPAKDKEFDIIYEDEDLIVVDKPAEFLSVPGIHIQDSIYKRILDQRPEISGPVIIHRLDMSTSGILVLAKNKTCHQFVQEQFINHTIQKRYTALLDGKIEQRSGLIDLPLRVDLDDRPRQVVCNTYGKPAQTRFEVIDQENNQTRVHFFPLTGRTHQLRVHAAHHSGLNTAIVGDDLYGTRANRLHLHAGYIRFVHPTTKKMIEFEVADPF